MHIINRLKKETRYLDFVTFTKQTNGSNINETEGDRTHKILEALETKRKS